MKETPVLESSLELFETLRQVSFFSALKEAQIVEIFKVSRLRRFEAGETIIPEGAFDTYLYVLLAGVVEVVKQGTIIATLNAPGEIFGELSILNCEARSASVVTISKTSCLAVDASFLENLLPDDRVPIHAAVYKVFAEIVSRRLRATSEDLMAAREEIRFLRTALAKR
jgi:CRP/FNR family cyclic AMP-dependent transcriptional regulator